jgi:hypothetical protein
MGVSKIDPDNTVSIETLLPDYRQKPGEPPVQVIFTSREPVSSQYDKLHFVLLNSGSTPVYYTGYTPDSFNPDLSKGVISPFFLERVKIGGLWSDKSLDYCGVGLASMRLLPGQAGRFMIVQMSDEESVQVGGDCYPVQDERAKTGAISWSNAISSH